MIKKISKFIRGKKDKKMEVKKNIERQNLIKKVERGTDFVIQEYGDALKKLAAYDRE